MAVSNVIERLGRAIFETPFGARRIAKDAPELAEIRIAVLDAVKAKSHRASGRNVFPYNLVRINLLGVPDEQANVFRGEFLATYFAEELRNSLARSNYRFPEDLHVEITSTPELPAAGKEWLTVDTAVVENQSVVTEIAVGRVAGKLLVLTGTANRMEINLEKPRTNIGRTELVYREGAGLSRRNDLAFSEDDEVSRSVSREHAHILYSPETNEYRVVNDRIYKGAENCGAYRIRDGVSQAIHRNARGTVLENGDEIQLGKAVLRFQRE